jgi:hypothetical protein
VECAEWGGSAEQRDKKLRQIGKETDKQVKHYASSVIPLVNTSRRVILLEPGNSSAVFRPKGKSPEGN